MVMKDETYKKAEKFSDELEQTRAEYSRLLDLSEKLENAYKNLDKEFSGTKQ